MKIRTELRKHYFMSDRVWVPKRAFKSEAEIHSQGFHLKFTTYLCPVCNFFHISKYDLSKGNST